MKKAIVIGASSGIGKKLALILLQNGYQIGLIARRVYLLKTLQ
jgi:short-subunit dehydrogenase